MENHVAAVSRRAAARLTEHFGEALAPHVEVVLAQPGKPAEPTRYVGADLIVAVASLLVSVVGVAWPIIKDLRKGGGEPAPSVVQRQVTLKLELPRSLPSEDRGTIIRIAVEEALRQGEEEI